MGFTHYWTQHKDVTIRDWARIAADVGNIIKRSPVKLVFESDEPTEPPQINDQAIRFNGIGAPDGEGYETFMIEREIERRPLRYIGEKLDWSFCKTANRRYDIAVTAVLAYLDSIHPEYFTVTSDGDSEDWNNGVTLAKQALPGYGNDIVAPREVRLETENRANRARK